MSDILYNGVFIIFFLFINILTSHAQNGVIHNDGPNSLPFMHVDVDTAFPVLVGGQIQGNDASVVVMNKYDHPLTAFTIVVQHNDHPPQAFTIDTRLRGFEIIEKEGFWAKSLGSNNNAASKVTILALLFKDGSTYGTPFDVGRLILNRRTWVKSLDSCVKVLKNNNSDKQDLKLVANLMTAKSNAKPIEFVANCLREPNANMTTVIEKINQRKNDILADAIKIQDGSPHQLLSSEVATFYINLLSHK